MVADSFPYHWEGTNTNMITMQERNILLYTVTDTHIYYWGLDTNLVKISNHAIFDEVMNILDNLTSTAIYLRVSLRYSHINLSEQSIVPFPT